jgi:hypothetical protein
VKFKLLPYKYKYLGVTCLTLGSILAYFVIHLNYKPDLLDIPVFAIYSSYINKVIFGITQTNIADELAIILLLAGIILLGITRRKNEQDYYQTLRIKALVISVFTNLALMILATLTIFGLGYLTFLVINLFTQVIFYLIFFEILVFVELKKSNKLAH